MIGQIVSHYRILERLGKGGMGVVYKAEDTTLGRTVAIKFLPEAIADDATALERFHREARAASALNHPNIVTVHEIGKEATGSFLVMEWVQGETLRSRLKRSMDLAAVIDIGLQVARALKTAHRAGIIHRDIKPENIMVRSDGYIKLVDFGLARLGITSDGETVSMEVSKITKEGSWIGTIDYFSPEQARAESLEWATDIFSFGIVLYEAATGVHPFAAASPFSVANGILSQDPIPPTRVNPGLPPTLERLLISMLQKDWRLRPTAAEVEQVLDSLRAPGSDMEALFLKTPDRHTVGRSPQLRELHAALELVTAGRGSLVCVSGEAGIGKSTLIEEFAATLKGSGHPCSVARGRCSERLADGEAYLPILEALDSLLHSASGDSVSRIMRTLAPSWFLEMAPARQQESTMIRLADSKATSQERLKREFLALLQELCRHRPLLLFLEDVHWIDTSTVDLLAYITSRFESLPLLVVITYRAGEMVDSMRPLLQLKLDLEARGLSRELSLQYLGKADVEGYLALEFPENLLPASFSEFLWQRTEGNPLFMVDLVRDLRDRKIIVREQGRWILSKPIEDIGVDLPASVRSMIQRKIDSLSEPDRRLLQAASVEGAEFHSVVLASVVSADAADVEERLENIERNHFFIQRIGEKEFPDGTLTLHLRFVHVLYQNALYAMLTPTRRTAVSGATANKLLELYPDSQVSVAHQVALLFEAARNFARAAEFFQIAAERAAGVFANQEAAFLARKGLEMLAKLPASPEKTQKELALQITLGPVLVSTKGFANPEVEQTYTRAKALCAEQGHTPALFPVLFGLWNFYEVKGQLDTSLQLAERMLKLAEESKDSALLLEAHYAFGDNLFWAGDFERSLQHCEQAVKLYNRPKHHSLAFVYGGYDPAVASLAFAAWDLWMLGHPEQAVARSNDSLTLADSLRHPFSQAIALSFASMLHHWRHDQVATRQFAEQTVALCTEHGIAIFLEMGKIMLGWVDNQEKEGGEGIELIREAIADWRASGAELVIPQLQQVLAAALARGESYEEALMAIEEALSVISNTGDRSFEADCWRWKGELLWRSGEGIDSNHREAEACLHKAIAIARQQKAVSLELRAHTRLSPLLARRGEVEAAHRSLAEVHGKFKEGFDTHDLKHARQVLEELRGQAESVGKSTQ
jgi:tetratricopeptide (TPR) repeat protein